MDENGGVVHRKCDAYNGGKVREIDQIEGIELFDWPVWDSFLLLVGGILGYNITYNIYHNRI